jgi:hypothetical protein
MNQALYAHMNNKRKMKKKNKKKIKKNKNKIKKIKIIGNWNMVTKTQHKMIHYIILDINRLIHFKSR